MAESIVQVTEGSGKKLHTWSYTVGANTVEDEVVVPGPYPWPTYTVIGAAVSIATANDHILCLNAGASLKVRVHAIHYEQFAAATTAAVGRFAVLRTTTGAPTGGTAVTPAPFEIADGASSAAGRSLPTVKGTESVDLFQVAITYRQAVSATAAQADDYWDWPLGAWTGKPIIIPAGTTNGLVIKQLTAVAGATVMCWFAFTETAF